MTAGRQPVVGWRLWKLHSDRLRSWVVPQDWEPGPNEARCLTDGGAVSLLNGRGRCMRPPGTDCKCGLWALWHFTACARKAREESASWERRSIVIGLTLGWGTVAIHGDEGFRSQYAAVRCLFTDPVAGRTGSREDWWDRLLRRLRVREPGDERSAALQQVAARYGVPLLSLADSVRLGVLGELGVPQAQVHEVAAELAVG